MTDYNGFDPLEAAISKDKRHTELINAAKRREIRNILKSYTGYFDVFSELIQNSLDATERVWIQDKSFKSKIKIEIDLKERMIAVCDNGDGMTKDQFEFCLAPNISFKRGENLRGNKGVGATFLAYGFNSIKLHTKSKTFEAAVKLSNGRKWVEDTSGEVERPKFEDYNDKGDWLANLDSGTIFKIELFKGEKPDLNFLNATKASQWMDVLRIKTPLGGIYLTSREIGQFRPSVKLIVKDYNGEYDINEINGADYLYPHDIPNLKIKSIKEIERALSTIPGDFEEKFNKLSDQYKKLEGIFEIWDYKSILDDNDKLKISTNLIDDFKQLLREHRVSVYAAFVHSTRIFDNFNDRILNIRQRYRILRGGLQMASDGMPQGELINLTLGKNPLSIGQSHVIVHFENGEPDLGRKTFQEEKVELAEKLAENAINLLRKFRKHLKSDETSEPLTPKKEKEEWKLNQLDYFRKNPLIKPEALSGITILSRPQKEQDVVALFNQLIGKDFIKGIEIYATSEHERYDSVFKLNYKSNDVYYSSSNPFGINENAVPELPWDSEIKILEYKYDFDALVRECIANVKFHNHIDLVVTWNASLNYTDHVELKSLLVDERGKDIRTIFGATHCAYFAGHDDKPLYEVIILEDLINYLIDADREIQRQKSKYEKF